MKSNFIVYDFEKSRARIDEILKAEDSSYVELDYIPTRDKLTYTNGFYVNCSAFFIDIRKSSELPNKYKRPTLAKIYRSFLSEIVATLNGNSSCCEIDIQGDSVWGIFDTKTKENIDELFDTVAKCSSIISFLNYKFKTKSIDPISVGIGLSYGRALMIKGGYDGSGINEVIWMGDVVNEASKLCSYANRTTFKHELMVSKVFYNNLNNHNRSLLSWDHVYSCYTENILYGDMKNWFNKNCKK